MQLISVPWYHSFSSCYICVISQFEPDKYLNKLYAQWLVNCFAGVVFSKSKCRLGSLKTNRKMRTFEELWIDK